LVEIDTNRNLLVFSILLIVAGISFGIYLVSVLGFFLLFPALLTTPKPRQYRTPPSRTQEQPRRIAPRPPSVMEILPQPQTPAAAVTVPLTPTPVVSQTPYTPALFPKSIFPTLSLMPPTGQQVQPSKEQAPAPRDELLEVGTLVAVLKLFFG
jgi:hypothetical protein